ncbi:tRNA (Guanine37-N(1)-) methyltransferase [Hydrocarboniphaga daqingensis]|jgi:tRNA (guanine37-N1)-methyltransferase|uniref:tRNA (guanine-N(1)-)-methyltransferase n=1 Tax=Hydrocarboniphaga daqingensis TaxID=490188 RepID=A0A1M5RVC5_9GAMM|nr:tRNA (guanosine(37)-N1)-methyltransferase TrmD [Hydrocarboniphaga daqingensis]SHH30194.1 tRNA (Guanine37-N(1)-) methyltransferase [Hydrocarboniphaga daqingensis]
MKIEVLTLFPELVEQVGAFGMPRVAVERGALQLSGRQLRDFSGNRWRRVDERTYGGGPGMVLQAEPLAQAIEAARVAVGPAKVVLMSPQGERYDQAWAERLSREPALILVCGRYEGIDERVMPQVDVELSVGDYVLSGGELAAMLVVDSIARLLPGVLGDEQSAASDSFSDGLLDHPHYSRPEVWRDQAVPEILMSGDHAAIRRWRRKQGLERTLLRRPDLLDSLKLDAEQIKLLREIITEQLHEQEGRT